MIEIGIGKRKSVFLKVGKSVGFKEDYLFWHIIHTLTSKHGYSIATMSDNQNEVWLENYKEKKYPLFRLMRLDFDWANVLKKDLQRTALNGENIRKQLIKKDVAIFNVYVSQYKPVDEYESMIKSPIKHKKSTITSTIIDSISWKEELVKVEQQLGKSMSIDEIPIDVEESQVQVIKSHVLSAALNKRKEEQQVFQYGKPFFTKIFLVMQIIVFALMEIVGSSESTITLIEFGAKYNPYILQGEWWRFITPVFIHIGFLHLILNSMALYYLGSSVERIYGSVRFFIIYLFAGFAGVLASFVFTTTLSAGASGAIFGCLGALLYFGLANKKMFFRTMGMNIIFILIINLSLGFIMPGIDNAGHIGGLIGGFFAATAIGLPKKSRWLYQIGALIVLLIGSAAFLVHGFEKQMDSNQDLNLSSLAQEYIDSGDSEKAKGILTETISNYLESPNAHFLLGNIEIENKEYQKAQVHYLQAVEMNQQFHQAHYNLALTYLQQGNVSEASKHVELALEIEPSEPSYQELKGEIDDWIKKNNG